MITIIDQRKLIGLLARAVCEILSFRSYIIPLGICIIPLLQLYVVASIPIVPCLEINGQQ
jgi:hypothetical protein